MISYLSLINRFASNQHFRLEESFWQRIHLDGKLFVSILFLLLISLAILYSGSNQNVSMVLGQGTKFIFAILGMIVLAQIPPHTYRTLAPWLFGLTLVLLVAVMLVGQTSQGAKRWLGVGAIRFQPSEIMKLALPLVLAWYFQTKKIPPKFLDLILPAIMLVIPFLLIAKQPDLGTALLILFSSATVFLLIGMSWRLILGLFVLIVASMPIIWHLLHDYQKERVLTFLNPERDPLGSGYHIIQSKIAIGSGGFFGKGFLHGSQAHLAFLPEHATDFIFAVCGEELGFLGAFILIFIYFFITARCLYIASQAQDTFGRLVAGSLAVSFFLGVFINIGMVCGLLPVVGLPLPMVSYGGTAAITSLASFGILMSIHTHRKLIAS